MSDKKRDVVILGGGLAGLSLALQCRQKLPKARITVVEKNAHPVPEAAHKVGESTVEVGAHYFANVLGLKDHIEQDQLPKLGLRFFFPNGDNSRIENRLELGGRRYAPAASYQLDRGRFENFLGERIRESGVEFIDKAEVRDLEVGNWRKRHTVRFEQKGNSTELSTRWLVDASGRRALLKRHLGLQQGSKHHCNATWFRVNTRIKVDDWCDDPAWQREHNGQLSRWYSTNHLMGQGYWVWLIPLASGSTSVGIVAAEEFHPLNTFNSLEKSLAWLDKHEPQCAAEIRQHEDGIQDFLAIKDYALECKQVFSQDRWGIVGEAGFFHDPFYSPGSDFIAFANTFLSDLIWRDLKHRGYRIRAFSYDKIFKKFYYGTLATYEDQYQLFGNPRVMPVKILWDYLTYWSITCFIFMHGRTCMHSMYMQNFPKLNRLADLNHFMQKYLREWHKQAPMADISGVIDISNIDLIRIKNEALLANLSGREFTQQFAANVAQIETLFWEIYDAVGLDMPTPFRRKSHPGTIQNGFAEVFDVIRQENGSPAPQPSTPLA